MRLPIIREFNKKNVGNLPCQHFTFKQAVGARKKARKHGYIKGFRKYKPAILRGFRKYKPAIPSLSLACQTAIASNIYSSDLSRLVDVAIVQAETRYELEFAGFAP